MGLFLMCLLPYEDLALYNLYEYIDYLFPNFRCLQVIMCMQWSECACREVRMCMQRGQNVHAERADCACREGRMCMQEVRMCYT